MTKKARKTGKRSLALFMTVLMLMTSWVFVAPSASAATAGNYTISVDGICENDAYASGMEVIVYYKPNNGTGTETHKTIYSRSDNFTWDGTGNDDRWNVSIEGFPTKVEYKVKKRYSVGTLTLYCIIYVNGVNVGETNHEWYNTSGWKTWTWTASSDKYPYANSMSDGAAISGASELTIPKTGASNLTSNYTYSGTVKDQYGVDWYQDLVFYLASSEPQSVSDVSDSFDSSKASIGGTGTLTLKPACQIAGTTNSVYAWVCAKRGNAWLKMRVKFVDPKYTVKFYDGDSNQFGSTQNVYYGDNATNPGTPTKSYTSTLHYTFTAWDDYTNIVADRDVNASFDAAAHTYGSWSTDTATCTAGGSHSRTCSVCSYKQTESTSALGHNWVTTVNANHLKSGATCTSPAIYYKWCSRCGANHPTDTFTNGSALGHDFTGAYQNVSDGRHNRKCSRCNEYGIGSGTSATVNGTEACSGGTANCVDKAVCSKCSTAYGNVDPANHKSTENRAAVANSCETDGYTAGVFCTACNQWVSGHEPVAAKGHDYTGAVHSLGNGTHNWACKNNCGTYGKVENGTQVKDGTVSCDATYGNWSDDTATCLEGGSHSRTCSECGYTQTEATSQLGHNWVTTVSADHLISAADCETPATYHKWCSRCGANHPSETFTNGAALGHNYTGAAHNLGNGTHNWACKNGCGTYGKVEGETQVKNGVVSCDATYGAWSDDTATCTAAGSQSRTCSECGYVQTRTTDPLNHHWVETADENHKVSDATCEVAKTYHKWCDRCGDDHPTDTFTVGNPLGHDYTGTARDNGDGTHSWLCKNNCGTYGKVDNGTQVKDGKTGHTYGDFYDVHEATCTEEGSQTHKCTVCNKVETLPIPTNDNHDWDDGEITTPANCHDLGVKTFTCSRCGATKTEDVAINPNNHKHLVRTAPVDNGCENDGNIEYWFCDGCNKYYGDAAATQQITQADTVLAATGHDFSAAADRVHSLNDGTHNWVCANGCGACGKVENNTQVKDGTVSCDATYGNWTTDTATCTAGGSHSRTCSACGYVQTEPTPQLGHRWVETVNPAHKISNADCEHAAVYHKWCSRCGIDHETDTFTDGDPLGHDFTDTPHDLGNGTHNWKCSRCNEYGIVENGEQVKNGSVSCADTYGDWETVVQNDCVNGGSEKRTCSVCGHVETKDTNPLGHLFTKQTVSDSTLYQVATCNSKARYWYSCDRCGEIERDDNHTFESGEFDPNNHNYVFERTVDPWCETQGYDIYRCSRCGDTQNRNFVDALNHTWGAWTSISKTQHKRVCERDANHTQTENHNMQLIETIAPTCEAIGYEVWTCSVCGYSEHREEQAALGHDFTGDVRNNDNGTHSFKCTHEGCGKYGVGTGESAEINGTENCRYGAWSEDTATCLVGGSHTKTCDVCGHPVTEATPPLGHDFTEAVPSDATMYLDANCTDSALYFYTCSRCHISEGNAAHVYASGDPLGHDWETEPPEYVWKDNNTHMTATLYCGRAKAHYITEDATVTKVVTKEATCTEKGVATYTATFANDPTQNEYNYKTPFTTQTTTSDVDKLPHTLTDDTHHAAVAPTCTEPGNIEYWICEVCGGYFEDVGGYYPTTAEGVVLPIDPDAHDWGDWTDNGADNHKRVCSRDEVNHVETEAHSWKDIYSEDLIVGDKNVDPCTGRIECYQTCEVCGRTNDDAHTFVVSEGTGHKMPLIHHEATDADCVTAGNREYWECEVCGKYFSDAAGTQPIDKSSVIIQPDGHDWDMDHPAWYWVKTEGGYDVMAVFTCKNNGDHQKSARAAATPTETDATCTTGGSVTWTATVTFEGTDYTANPRTETVDALGHQMGDWSVTTEATCDHAGVETRTCQRSGCDYSETRPIAKLAHKLVYVPAVAPTCTEAGSIAHYQCALCGKYFSDAAGTTVLSSIIDPATGHSFTGAYKDNGDGTHSRLCVNGCGTYGATADHAWTEQNTGANYAVNGQAADCTSEGHYYYSCVCGACENNDDHTFTAGGSLGHVLHEIEAVAATCKADGHDAYWYCSRCGKYFTDSTAGTETTPAAHIVNHSTVAHTWGDWTEKTAPTCTTIGKEERTCSVCGLVETRDVPVIAHDYTGDVVTYNNGTHAHKCKYDCGMVGPIESCEASKEQIDSTSPNCVTMGDTTYKCTVCDYEWTVIGTGFGPHAGPFTHHVAVPATCTTAGTIEYWSCDLCGVLFSDEEHKTEVTNITVPALNHEGIFAVAQQDADCTHDGVKAHFECPICNKLFSDATAAHEVNAEDLKIPQLGHNFYGEMKDNEDGTHSFKCTRCDVYGNPTAHTFDRKVVNDNTLVSAADCLNPAKYHYSCACGAIDTQGTVGTFDNGQPTGHAYNSVKAGSWVWTKSGETYTVTATVVCANDADHEATRNAVVTFTTTAPNCDAAGTRKYTATITLDNGTTATDNKDEEVAKVGHSLVETAAVEETCETAGNSKYYTCSVCHKYFSDAAGTNEIDANSWVIPAKGHNFDYANATYVWNDTLTEVVATAICKNDPSHKEVAKSTEVTSTVKTPATCTEKGTTTYTATFATPLANQTKDVQDIPTVAHTLTKTEAVEATCTVEGFDAYWTCSECGKIFSDENGDHEISEVTKALDPDNHKTLVHTAKVDATCLVNGNIEYWTCNDCHQKLVYNDAGKLVEVTDVVIPAGPAHHRFTTHVSAKDATCTQQGNVEYWTCSVCGKHFNGNTESATELTKVSTDPLGHDVTRTAAVAPTCTTDGNKEYWYCARCHQYFLADSITAEPVAFSATVDPKKGHTAVSVDAVAVQCEADGNKAYSYCSVCDTILTLDGVDVSLNGWTRRGNSDVYTITQTGHAYGNPTWTWNDDHTSATATRICANDPTHTVSMTDNEIESVIIDKTHTTDGKATYTAEVTFAYDNKTFTDVVEIVDTASGHHTTKVDAKDATCEATGNLEYWICNDEGCGKLFKDENALVETTLEAVTIAALGHNYVNPTWTWTQNGNFYTGATLTFTCANDATHKQTPEVTFTADQTNPDCTNAGKIVYTATATFEGKTYTDTKEVTLGKTGHTLTATAAKDATCLADGNIAYWTCSVCNKIFSDENARYEITAADTVIAALGHTYDYAHTDYDWSTDHSSCTATATCIRCDATDTETKASTNNVKIPATCEAQGIRIYTVDFDNANFATQTYDELIPATGHGTAVMHEGKAATCEAAGFEAYWTCSVCGKLFKAETLTAANEIANPIVIPAKGHDWDYTKENVTYTWSATEPYTCTATVTCKNDGTHTKDVTGSVTITDSTEANCTTDGSRTYTATFPADTSIPNDTKTATTPALGHDFSESIDRAHVVDGTHHNYKCVRCNAYGIMDGEEAKANESVACTFHGDWFVSENETCTEPGSEWRKCDFCSNKETREREELSHQVFSVDAKNATCVAIGNKAYTYCERCGLLLTVDGTSVEAQNIKFNANDAIELYKTEDMLNHDLTATAAKAATCEADGNIAYWTCSLCGKIFNIENPTAETTAITLTDTVIPATKHDFTGAVRDNGDNTHSKKCTKCDAYGIMVNGTPVKDGKEACYGGNATCTADAVCTVCGHTYQTKSGHNYVLQSWTWNGYTAATAHYVCANDATHKKDVEATVNKTDATVTCTAAGQNTYVATATFTDGDKTYTDTDTKTEVVNATGHNWDFENAVYSWDANQNCTVTLKCLNNEEHVYTEIGKNTTATTPATCEDTGSVLYTATFTINSTLTSTHTETLAALGHKWGDPAWTWTGNDTDGYTATVKLVCDRVASHEATPDVTVTKDTVAPTCEKDGRTVYTATATLDGRTYKDTKITIQPAKGHDWQAPVFTWTEAANGGYSAATALIACNNDPAHNQTLNCALTTETDDATCTEGGTVTYTATVTFNGQTYTEKKTAEVTALGHKYAFVDFTWTGNDADGYTAAVANFKCANDPAHTTTAAATVATEKVDAICEADGKITYTATVTFEGKEYTDEKVVVLPMLHHDWGDATYTWVKDGDQYKVTALRVCANNPGEHQQTVTVTTTSQITESSGCESEGTILYTATFEAPFATQTREESVAVAGHTLVHTDYLDSTCTKAGNIEYWRCSVCGKIFTDEAAAGDSYLGTDLAATVIAAKDHDFVMEGKTMVVLDNEDGTHSFKCSRCDAYGAVIDGAQKEKADGGVINCVYGDWKVTRKATCMDLGEQQATCKICRHVETRVIGYADHVIVRISAKSAKCEADGNKEYFKCNVCGKLFTDAAATTETSLEAVTLPKLGHNFTGAIHNDGNGTTHSYLCVNGCGTYGNPQAHEFDQQIASQTYLRNVATCTEPATYYKSCACGAKSTDTFTKGSALGHIDVTYTGQPATCTQAGHTEYTECTRCHRREGYQVIDALSHGAYLPGGTGASADGSLKWTVYKCDHNCGDYYVVLNVTSIDAQGTRVPNVNVTITGNNTNITGKTDGNGDLKLTDEAKNRLMPGVYTVALEYVRDGSNYNTRGTVTVKDGTVTGSYGKLTPYGGNASGSMGGEPTGEFRCSMCNTYESTKNVPVYGWFISIIHFFVHMISRIGK